MPSSATTSAHETSRSAFERMDAAPSPAVLENTQQRLTVGVRDAGLGWVEIRTHAAAGQVSAVLATGTPEAHAALSSQLPEVREYLATQHVRVDTLAAEQFSSSSGGQNASAGRQSESRETRSTDGGSRRDVLSQSQLSAEGEPEGFSYINVRV